MAIGSSHRVVLCTLLAIAGCTSAPGKDFFTETIDSLHAKNSPLRAGYTGPSARGTHAGYSNPKLFPAGRADGANLPRRRYYTIEPGSARQPGQLYRARLRRPG